MIVSYRVQLKKGFPAPVREHLGKIFRQRCLNYDFVLVRSLFPLETRPGMISLLAGKPNPTTFPFTSLNFTSRSPMDPSQEVVLSLTSDELGVGLQYGQTAGLDGLVTWVEGLQAFAHGRKHSEGWTACIGTGSQDLIYKVGLALISHACNPHGGE